MTILEFVARVTCYATLIVESLESLVRKKSKIYVFVPQKSYVIDVIPDQPWSDQLRSMFILTL